MNKKNIFGHKIYSYTGCIHVHSEHSFDSKVPVEKIVNAAQAENLDFITFNDHRDLGNKQDLEQIDTGELITIPGWEMNDPDKNNHYLVYNTDSALAKPKPVKNYIDKIDKMGGTTFIAHPFETRKSKLFRRYEWNYWQTDKFNGIEIWNYLSQWIDALSRISTSLQSIFSPNCVVRKPLKSTLKQWDKVNIKGLRKSAIGGVDAHGKTITLGPLSFTLLPHRKLFKTIRTNIWLREELDRSHAQDQILQALRNGNSIIANYTKADPEMFYCGIFCHEKDKLALPGEEISLSVGKLKFYIYLPQDCHIHLIRNGKKVLTKYTNKVEFNLDKPGFYRLEILRGIYGWIYSNPIYVTE